MDTRLDTAFLPHHSIGATSCRTHTYCQDLRQIIKRSNARKQFSEKKSKSSPYAVRIRLALQIDCCVKTC